MTINNLAAWGAIPPLPEATTTRFGLALDFVAHNNLTDFNTKNDLALYKTGKESIPITFDMKLEQAVIFEKEFANKVTSWIGWSTGTQNITKYINQDNLTNHLISQDSQIDHNTNHQP